MSKKVSMLVAAMLIVSMSLASTAFAVEPTRSSNHYTKNPFGDLFGIISCASPDYDFCYDYVYDYGDAHAKAEVDISHVKPNYGNVAQKPYLNLNVNDGSKLYLMKNKQNWDTIWSQANCNEFGCSGATEIMTGKYTLLENYGTYTDCPAFISWNKNEAENGDYAWTVAGYGWTGTSNCLPSKYVQCVDDSTCNYGYVCDTAINSCKVAPVVQPPIIEDSIFDRFWDWLMSIFSIK